jgi:hypothetical protein
MAERTCRVCGRVDPPGRMPRGGRCSMCEAYWRRHGGERPPGPPRGAAIRRPCTICGQLIWKRALGRCPACYGYWHRHGHERPSELWQRE